MYKYIPLKGKSYIALPNHYSNNNKGLCNIKNDDEKCFKWCHIAFLFPVKNNKNNVRSYINHEKDVDYTGISFSVTLNQINFNIFTLSKNTVLPLFKSDKDY